MTDQEIIQYANKNLWYLREGDYLPEPLSSMYGGRGVNCIEFLNEMRRLGTVYPTRETASIVSEKIRKVLGQIIVEMRNARVLVFMEDEWTVTVISINDAPSPITWKETFKLVSIYLNHGKGFFIRRLVSVLIRLFTCSLKPKQTSPSGKCGTTTSFRTSSQTE